MWTWWWLGVAAAGDPVGVVQLAEAAPRLQAQPVSARGVAAPHTEDGCTPMPIASQPLVGEWASSSGWITLVVPGPFGALDLLRLGGEAHTLWSGRYAEGHEGVAATVGPDNLVATYDPDTDRVHAGTETWRRIASDVTVSGWLADTGDRFTVVRSDHSPFHVILTPEQGEGRLLQAHWVGRPGLEFVYLQGGPRRATFLLDGRLRIDGGEGGSVYWAQEW